MARYEVNLTDSGTLPDEIMGYRVRDLLGESVGITTYRVRDEKDAGFALKHVIVRNDAALRYVEHLKNEYEIAKQVNHPNLRKAVALKLKKRFGLFQVQEAALVLEQADGLSLELHKSPGDSLMLRFFYQVAMGLAELHKMGYVHADVRPSNVTVNVKARKAKLIDYGDSCKIGSVLLRPDGLPDYLSPEHVENRPLTVKSDIFCFGSVLYWGLCRRSLPDMTRSMSKSTGNSVSDWVFESPRKLNPRMPRELSKLIERCLELNPANRPASMSECIDVISTASQEWESSEIKV